MQNLIKRTRPVKEVHTYGQRKTKFFPRNLNVLVFDGGADCFGTDFRMLQAFARIE